MKRNILKIFLIFVILVLIIGLYFYFNKEGFKKTEKQNKINSANQIKEDIEVIAQNLNIPWEIAFLPEGEILVTERPGNLLLIKNKKKISISGVEHVGEGGLLGLAVHPDFLQNRWIYLYLTARTGDGLVNRVERYKLEKNELLERTIIIQGINGASNHDGGRMAFGPDGYLYITAGDAQNPGSAQDINSLNGKILRIKGDGTIPPDNPFKNEVYSFGHRNSQGIAWDDKGRLWATEHGRSGLQSGFDELNLIEKGNNYGWPEIEGGEKQEGMVAPIIHSGATITWAPSGAAFYKGSIFFGGLRGEALFEYKIEDKSLRKHFEGEFGRIRAVALGPDGFLYITTSNTDGRGQKKEEDDKLIKINTRFFSK